MGSRHGMREQMAQQKSPAEGGVQRREEQEMVIKGDGDPEI